MVLFLLTDDHLITLPLVKCRYGRYRPWNSPLAKKLKGWQYVWWHYAQESVLSDVHKKLKKTSWRYLGQRLYVRSFNHMPFFLFFLPSLEGCMVFCWYLASVLFLRKMKQKLLFSAVGKNRSYFYNFNI